MAAKSEEEILAQKERDKIKQEKKKLADEQKKQKQEAKKRAKELEKQEEEWESDSAGGMFGIVLVALVLVLIWIGIFALIIKLDIGNLGSNVAAPILKNVPVVKYILPKDSIIETTDVESYYGYTSLADAVTTIKSLETQLQAAQEDNLVKTEQISALTEEVTRLKTFEANQLEFQRIKNEFFEQVVYAEKGPGISEYRKYYEAMDPETADYIYRQVISKEEVSQEVKDYAQAYSEMKPKEAAGIFEAMPDNLQLAAKILYQMSPEDRGKILGVMDPDVAAKITKIMNPS